MLSNWLLHVRGPASRSLCRTGNTRARTFDVAITEIEFGRTGHRADVAREREVSTWIEVDLATVCLELPDCER